MEAPPEIPRIVPGNILLKLLPVVMVAAMIGMVALMFTSGAASNPLALMFPAMMVISMLGMFAGGGGRGGGTRSAEIDESRKDYLAYLDRLRAEVSDTACAQRKALEWAHPAPAGLWTMAGSNRMWERRTTDQDFAHVRVGTGSQRLATRLVAPETGPVDLLEPVAAVSLRSFVRTHSIVPDLPTAVSLRGFAAVGFDGDREQVRSLVRSIVMQLCVFHGPDDLLVAIVTGRDEEEWDWAKWLPHNHHPDQVDGAGSSRMIYRTVAAAGVGLGSRVTSRGRFVRHAPGTPGVPHVVVILDGAITEGGIGAEVAPWISGGTDSVTVLDLADGVPNLVAAQGLQLVVDGRSLRARSAVGVEVFGQCDEAGIDDARVLARSLARYTISEDVGTRGETSTDSKGWNRLLSIGDPGAVNPDRTWTRRQGRDRLRVPVGTSPDGRAVEIDLKEAAEGGMGPHGLCIGATGSGKSEFLRTLVLGLIATHAPDVLNLVLVDFKGGATFLGLEHAPHVAAVITNLEDERALVERMRDALAGEMNRRQEVLRSRGNFANVSDYTRARDNGAELEPLPALFVVVDEFSELLSQYPDFADLFVAIGRLGRSLHMHLLLASQRLDEGRLRGLDSHLSYRIGLKTFSANESRSVLGVADAYHLPARPGSGYLKTDSSDIVRFSAAYVSGEYRAAAYLPARTVGDRSGDGIVRLFTAAEVPAASRVVHTEPTAPSDAGSTSVPTILETVVGRLQGHGRPAHRVWLPPLTVPPSLDELLDRMQAEGGFGSLRAPMGVVDRPFDQRRDLLTVDLTGSTGNVAIVGGPQSGKSTALRTMVMALASTHTAQEVQFYCVDFGGGTLASLEGLPHVGSVANRLDIDRVRRTVAEMTALIRRRERSFRTWGIESMAEFRSRRGNRREESGSPGPWDDPHGDVFFVLDGVATVRSDFESVEPALVELAAQGLSYGVHVVITASRWAEIRPALRDLLATRVELRLGDPTDSDIGRAKAMLVPEGRPGRGITKDGLHLLTALPRLDRRGTTDALGTAVGSAVESIAQRSTVPPAPPVRLLPQTYRRDDLLEAVRGVWPPAAPRRRVPIGIDESELAPVYVDFDNSPHFVVFGDGQCGKTTFLRSVCAGIVESNPPSRAKVVLADYRRTMLGAVQGDHLGGYASSSTVLATMMSELAGVLRSRRPGPETTQDELRNRSWWSGPDIWVVVDDYDLVVTPAGNPLAELVELLPQARDVGLHVVLARRAGGSARAMYEPVMSRLKDLASAGLIMSGYRDEGALLSAIRPSEQPPGRGTLVTRSASELIQTAWMPPL
ncbi:putative FtsK/SpoIIIE family protein [Rhodococcoides trifolii]|uniref:FtsK/SpoIIIE family protein n=1 Tax=Rhodococcoides trifolii TaxID=908250 RepID=A0A917FYI7_9NOCA|nr:putative FtsK/SpoIIIE family protein [Rhodococcus trifolii]